MSSEPEPWFPPPPVQTVRIVDLDLPFWHIVVFLIKVSLAAVPAALIVALIGLFGFAILSGVLVGTP